MRKILTLVALPACCIAIMLAGGCSSDTSGPNRAPVANSGPDRVVEVGKTVTLDGSQSYDPDGDELSYQWDVASAPRGGNTDIDDAQKPVATFTPGSGGVWAMRLVVSDRREVSEPDVMHVKAVPVGCTSDDECDDSIGCTDDRCNTETNECEYTPNDDNCPDDGEWCNGDEVCDEMAGCVHTGDPCQAGGQMCDEAGDRCIDCLEDGDCDDEIDCTTDSCDQDNGTCTNTPDDGACEDDGLYCNGPEVCDPEQGCTSSGDPCIGSGLVCDEDANECRNCVDNSDCNDDVDCTVDTCEGGVCIFTPDDNACPDDGDFCNGAEYCDAEAGCSHEGDPCAGDGQLCDGDNNRCVDCLLDGDCDDMVGCTDDTCNTTDGTCVFTPNDSNCPDDGAFCNGTEYCDAANDCSSTGDPCTAQSLPCDETNNVCVECGDGVVSDGHGEDCDPGDPQDDNCCDPDACTWVADGDPDPQDSCTGAPECQLDVCDGSGGCAIVNEQDGVLCTQNEWFCDGEEECQDGQCISPGNPCPNPDDCDEDNDICAGCGDGVVSSGEECDPAAPQGDNCCHSATCLWTADGDPDPQGDCSGAPVCQLDVCDGAGGCRFANEIDGTACGDNADTECDDPDSCQSGVCEPNYESVGHPCGDQDIECVVDDTCNGAGVCTDNGYEGAGTQCTDSTPDDCNDAQCNGGGTCDQTHAFEGDGTPCGDSSDTECDNPDSCLSGVCEPNYESSGQPCGDQGIECVVDDTCNGAGSCTDNGFEDAGTQCTDTTPADCNDAQCNGGGACDQAYAFEGDGTPCGDSSDTECDNPDSCLTGVCEPNYESSGQPCGDQGVECVVDDTCDGSGACTDNGYEGSGTQCNDTTPDDCNDAQCNGFGGCNQAYAFEADGTLCGDGTNTECDNPDSCLTGVCEPNYESSGQPCGDQGVECVVDDTCNGSGACIDNGYEDAGTQCNDTTPDDCNDAQCDGGGGCDQTYANEADGTPCAGDGADCTDDACLAGVCESTPNDLNCVAPDICWPNCTSDPSGCLTPPSAFTLTCDDPVLLPDASHCTINLADGDNLGQESCLSCSAEVGITTLVWTDFEDDDNPGSCAPLVDSIIDGWTVVPGVECYDHGDNCNMTGPDVRDCCNNVICPIDDGALTGTIAFQADRDTCVGGDRQWRLERTFDTTGLTDMRLCFDYADRQAGGHNDTIQVEIDDGTDFAVLFCDDEGPRDNVDDQFYRYCFDLPAWAAGNPALEVRFFLHSNDNNNRIFLDNISLTGWGGGCLKDIYEVFYDDLDDGTGSCDLSEWVISGTYHNCPGFDCNNEPGWSPGIDVDKNDTLFMETTISTLQLDGEVAVCFGLANDGANNGNLVALEYDVGAGPLLAWSQQGRLGPDKDCREICVDLSEIDPAVNNNPSLGLTFTMHSADKKIALYYVRVTGARYCEATNSEVSLSSIVGAGGGDYAFSATDTWGDQLTAQISCEWEPDPTIYVDRQSVWYRPLRLNPSNINEPVEQLLCVNSFDWTTTGAVTMNTDTGAVSGLAAGEIVFNVVPQGGGAPDLGVFSFHDIDIRHDVTVVGDNALVLLSCTDINIDGAINASGTSGVMNVSGACSGGFGGPGGFNGGNCLSSFPPHDGQGPGGGGVGAQAPCNWLVESGGAGASFGGTGGHGGDGDDGGGCSIAGPVPAVPYGTLELIPLIGGSGGGTGGDNYGGPGGGGGGAVQLSANGSITVGASGLIWAGGGGGAGGHDGGDSGAGGGAGSGGAILLEADTVSVDGTMAVNGGGGGAGFNGNPGWGSGIGASGQPGTSDESCALGGIATGSGGGNGGDGSCGDVTSGAPGGIAENGGGGGGAAGRIRVNTRSGSMSGSGVFSPSVSSGLVTEGFIETW